MGFFDVISKEGLLNKYGEYTIFKHYIHNFNVCGKLFLSELRTDNNPSCIITDYNGRLVYQDFGTGERYDCFSYVQQKYGLSFIEALNKINSDLSDGVKIKTIPVYRVEKHKNEYNIIKVQVRNWNDLDKSYWYDKYGLDEDILKKFNVYPITRYSINNNLFNTDELAYGYYYGIYDKIHRWKIYQPYNSRFKWISNTNSSVVQGYHQLTESDLLIITSSLKDVMVLNEAGYNACALQAESNILTTDILNKLKTKTKCSRIVSIYDNDEIGIKYANKLTTEYGIPSIFMPEGSKDPSEFVDMYDYFSLVDYVESNL